MSSEFNFYRHCWLTLKRSKPRMRKFMDEIECEVEGAGLIKDKVKAIKQKKESDRNANTNTPQGGVIV